MAREFIIEVRQVHTVRYRLDEDTARKAFPLIRWNEEDVSHAGDIDDEINGGAGLPTLVLMQDVDDADSEHTYRAWEE